MALVSLDSALRVMSVDLAVADRFRFAPDSQHFDDRWIFVGMGTRTSRQLACEPRGMDSGVDKFSLGRRERP
jgi:hypothetical protein